MKLLDPTVNLQTIAPRRRYHVNPTFRRRHMFGEVAKVLREVTRPMTAPEIAAFLAERHGMQLDKKKMNALASNVTQALKRRPETVIGDGGRPQQWAIRIE